MQIAHYDADGLFIGVTEAHPDPEATRKAGHFVPQIPARATEILPDSVPTGFVSRWNGKAWEQVEDKRGTHYWLAGETWRDEGHEMKELGPLPADAVTVRPEKSAEEKDKDARAAIRAERDRRITEVRWLIERHKDEVELGLDTTLKATQYKAVQTYVQQLRDLPAANGFPWNGKVDDPAVPWPLFPELKTAPELQPAE